MVDGVIENRNAPAEASARLQDLIKKIRAARDPVREMAALDAALVVSADGRRDVRRLLVSPYVRDGALPPAIAALEVLVVAYPSQADDRRMLASLFGRTKQWDRAITEADAAALIEPDVVAHHAARIQLRLQGGQVSDAAAVARTTVAIATGEPGEAGLWMLAFIRNGEVAEAARVAAMLEVDRLPNERAAAMAVRALLEDVRVETAIGFGQAALDAGHDSPALRTYLGLAYLRRAGEEDRKIHALAHFEAGLKAAPSDVRLLSLYGETLLRAGRYREALAPFEQAMVLAPALEQTQLLYARALRYSTQHERAANQLVGMLETSPGSLLLQRSAIGALSQAGRTNEAEVLYEQYVSARGRQLPATFQQALANIETRLDSAPIPQARFDWAWSLRGDTGADRAQWERKARWGHLMDQLLFDWLECREDQVEEAMQLLGDLEFGERFFAPLLAAGRGVVVATAHVGPMYASLMALELLGIPSRWLATAPNIEQSSYSSALISTADQTEAQVAKACMRALGSGHVLGLAVDGAANPAAPRKVFEGQQVTYSSFASRMAHRMGVPSVFYAPRWEHGLVTFTLELMPAVAPGEDVEAYAMRWQRAYFELLRKHLAGPPENLRLSGGIWRHVTSADRSAQRAPS